MSGPYEMLLTGATGFVGRVIIDHALRGGHQVRAAVRQPVDFLPAEARRVQGPSLGDEFDWRPALDGCEVVVHASARVHVMNESSPDPLAEYRRTNVQGTVQLARAACAAGVRRFVFISSIKVNGESTSPGRPFRADDVPAPADPYGVSKLEAEEGLRAVARERGIEVVIIRPVLVYGPGVKANFEAMMRWIASGLLLPLGSIHNRRSLVSVHNLADLVMVAATHPRAPGCTLLVSDGEDLSTTELLRRTARAMDRTARLVPFPAALLALAARAAGKEKVVKRLVGSLEVDIGPTMRTLDWQPPMSVDAALRETTGWFLAREGSRA